MKNRSANKQKLSGFTLIELLVVISIIALLLAILMPALTKVRRQSMSIVCKSNLHQVAFANQLYASNYKESIVPVFYNKNGTHTDRYLTFLLPYLGGKNHDVGGAARTAQQSRVVICPSDKTGGGLRSRGAYGYGRVVKDGEGNAYSYSISSYLIKDLTTADPIGVPTMHRMTNIRRPGETFFSGDYMSWIVGTYQYGLMRINASFVPRYRYYFDLAPGHWHGDGGVENPQLFAGTDMRIRKGRINLSFLDGHVETLDKDECYDVPIAGKYEYYWYVK